MCGLYGWSLHNDALVGSGSAARPRDSVQRKLLILQSTLSIMMDERGGDSWGMVGDGIIARGLGDLRVAVAAEAIVGYRTVLGHSRYATHGAKEVGNAHPLAFGGLVGMHNGVLSNHGRLNALHGRTFQVDSLHLLAHLEEDKPFTDIEGYATLVWYRKGRPHNIFLSHFNHADLCAYQIPKFGVVWASTSAAVELAMSLAQLEGDELDLEQRKVYEVVGGDCFLTPEVLAAPQRPNHKRISYRRWDQEDEDDYSYSYVQGGTYSSGGSYIPTEAEKAVSRGALAHCICTHSNYMHTWRGTGCSLTNCSCLHFMELKPPGTTKAEDKRIIEQVLRTGRELVEKGKGAPAKMMVTNSAQTKNVTPPSGGRIDAGSGQISLPSVEEIEKLVAGGEGRVQSAPHILAPRQEV